MNKKYNEKNRAIAADIDVDATTKGATKKDIAHATKTVEPIQQPYATRLSLIALLSSATPAKICVPIPGKITPVFVEALARLTGRTITDVENRGDMSDIRRVERVMDLHKNSELVVEIYDEDGRGGNRTIFIEKITGYTTAAAEEIVTKAFRSRLESFHCGTNVFAESINVHQLIIDGENGDAKQTFTWIEPGCGAKKGEYSTERLVISA